MDPSYVRGGKCVLSKAASCSVFVCRHEIMRGHMLPKQWSYPNVSLKAACSLRNLLLDPCTKPACSRPHDKL